MAYASKEEERQDLINFLAARKSATGEELTLVKDHEAPDFLCRRPDGSLVGIEHTKIEYNPEATELRHACRDYDDEIDNYTMLWAAFTALAKKEAKRRKSHWTLPHATILVFDLAEGIRVEDWEDDERLADDYADSGFLEVWISDHSSLETHGVVTAIGLFPKAIWGIQGQGYLGRPPYK